MKNLALIFATLLFVTGVAIYLWWGGIISRVAVEATSPYETTLPSNITACGQKLIGRSFWLVSNNTIVAELKACDIMVKTVSVKQSFPKRMTISVTFLNPVAKLPFNDHCELIMVDSLVNLPTERCTFYTVPVIKGFATLQGNPSLQFIQTIAKELNANSIKVTEIEYKDDITNAWVFLRLANKKAAYVPISVELASKISTLKYSLIGLENRSEKYSYIDLRFDRVVYK